jgi:hypothetical protein
MNGDPEEKFRHRQLASISTEQHSADVKQHQSESAESPGLQNRYVIW